MDELITRLQGMFLSRPGVEWLQRLEAAGVPCGPINTVDCAVADPQVLARHMLVEVHHPQYGAVQMPGSPIKPLQIFHLNLAWTFPDCHRPSVQRGWM